VYCSVRRTETVEAANLIGSQRGGHDYFKGSVSPWRPRLSAPSRQREAPATGNGPADHQCSQVRGAW